MPNRFIGKWMAYDARRPTRPRLARRFVMLVAAMLAAAAALAALTWR